MRRWLPLNNGDTVDIVAPGWGVTPDKLEGALAYLRDLNLRPRLPEDIFGDDPICSNTDEKRAEHLIRALSAKDSKAIWCIRGGYGAIRLLPLLEKWKKIPKPKLFIGYSDATTLHQYFYRRWKWCTIHGPLLDRLGVKDLPTEDVLELESALLGNKASVTHDQLQPLNHAAKKLKRITGTVYGGNLTVCASQLGTPWRPQTRDKILFFEDTGERGYRIDRLLIQMTFAKYFSGVRAVLFGEFIGGNEPDGSTKVQAAIERFAEDAKFPVFRGVHAGHGMRQRIVPLGTKAELFGGGSGRLVVDVGSVQPDMKWR